MKNIATNRLGNVKNSLGPTRKQAGEFETVNAVTLDSAVRDLPIDRVKFLKSMLRP
jgi:hypothetical protein